VGGSAYFDLVGRALSAIGTLSKPVQVILRSCCYLTSDYGLVHRIAQLTEREAGLHGAGLQSALEVSSCVLSRLKPGLAILVMDVRR